MVENQALLEKLYGAQTLTAAESEALFNAIMLGELSNEQISAMLVALKVRGETIDEVNGAVLAAVKNAKPFPTPDYPFADIVGTGGDGANTINISTASAIVAAACGAKVAKHGNRTSPQSIGRHWYQLLVCTTISPGFQICGACTPSLKNPYAL